MCQESKWSAACNRLLHCWLLEAHYQEALWLRPDWPEALGALARIRAIHPDPKYRDGAAAVDLAGRAYELAKNRLPQAADTLAAACAESGRFDDAVDYQERAIAEAKMHGQDAQAKQFEQRLLLYRAGRPYREGSAPKLP